MRVDATRDVGQKHVVGVMRRDTFGLNSLPRSLPSADVVFLFLSPCPRPFSFSISRGVVSYQRRMAGGEARPETRRGSREDARERERVELEARSVIRQVGIHIYRVVKSIGVSVSRVSCKESVVGMRCELIERERRGGEDGERTNDRASYLDVGLTETENGKPPFPPSTLPLRPLLLLRHPPAAPSRPPSSCYVSSTSCHRTYPVLAY